MHLCIVGAGYVGLVTGACLADGGHEVACVDNDAEKIDGINAGRMPIFEPGLDELVARNVRQRRLRFTTDLAGAVASADAVFIAVGTPYDFDAGAADLSQIKAVAGAIAGALDGYTVVIVKSTVPIGAGDEIEAIIRAARPDAECAVVSNPEFLREGAAIADFVKPNRIVIGTSERRAQAIMSEIYRPFAAAGAPMLMTSRQTAELIKYASNAFLATKLTYINQIADLCEKVGADVEDVARGMGFDDRIGAKFLRAGPGYGGSCFPKDTLALLDSARDAGVDLSLVESVVAANYARKRSMARRIVELLGGEVAGRTIGLLGLTFKPNTDDMRGAAALDLVPGLLAAGANVRAYDPQGAESARNLLPDLPLANDAYDCALGADALIFDTEWEEFRTLDFARIRSLLRQPVVIDLRNVFKPTEMRAAGFRYHSIGRSAVDGSADQRAGAVTAAARLRVIGSSG